MRPRGAGSVYRRGAVWWLKYYDADGHARRESSQSRAQADAARILRARLGEVAEGRRVLAPDRARLTFEGLRDLLLDDYRLNRRKTVASVAQSFRALGVAFAGWRAHQIDYAALQHYAAVRLAAGRAPATARREMILLHRAFVLAERAGLASAPPRFPSVSVSNARSGFFEAEQWQGVRAHLPPALRDVGDFAFLTGWRVMEILTLAWRQVDFAQGQVRLDVGATKNGEGRVFPFAALPELASLLERRRALAVTRAPARIVPWVFHRDGEPLFTEDRPRKSFRRAWRRACERAGYPGRLLHDFRRTAVRNLERAQVNRKVAMELVGMKTDAIYRRYQIVTEADLVEGVCRLAAMSVPR